MDQKLIFVFPFLIFAFFVQNIFAQCEKENIAFQSGEKITYDLYFKYGVINAKAGIGTLNTTTTNLNGKTVYKTKLQANTTGIADKMFPVNDTLTGYVDMKLVPLLFTKGASEGSEYSSERQSFSYENGKITIRTIRYRKGKLSFDEIITTDKCTYDYVSVLNYARNLDYSEMQPGENTHIQFVSGKKIVDMYMRYLGTTKVKTNDGKTYDAIELSLMILNKAFADQKEAMKVTLTDDLNRMPLIIDAGLKFGTMQCVLKDYSGLRYPIN